MSDNLTRYCAIRARLMQRQDATLNRHQRRNLHTFAQRVRGSVGSRKCPLPARASKVPFLTDTCRDSRIKRFERFTRNDKADTATFYNPRLVSDRVALAGTRPQRELTRSGCPHSSSV